MNETAERELQPLPNGWRLKRLGDICEVVNGFGFGLKYQGRTGLPYPFIKVSDMNAPGAEKTVFNAANWVDTEILRTLRAKTYPVGTVIFPKVGAALLGNKRRILGKEATFDNNIMGLIPRSATTNWLFYWMRTVDLGLISNTQALPSVKKSDIQNISIPLPPLVEQERIVRILDEKLAVIDKAKQAAETQIEATNALPQAYLRRAFAGEL